MTHSDSGANMADFLNSHRHRIFINADDYGVSQRANRNIRFLISIGKIDRVSAMANGDFSKADLEEILKSNVKIDIHLDILHEFNDSRKERQGVFFRAMEFLLKLALGKISPKKVRADWKMQIEKFKEIFGKYPDGINSHEHVHFFPPFFKIALNLQKEYSIPYIRFGESVFLLHNKPVAYVLHWLRIANMKSYRKSESSSSSLFIDLNWIDDFDQFLDDTPDGKIEIACHPEIADDFVKIKKFF